MTFGEIVSYIERNTERMICNASPRLLGYPTANISADTARVEEEWLEIVRKKVTTHRIERKRCSST